MIVPPMASTKPREIARPRPVPARTRSPFSRAIELLEDAVDLVGREFRSPRRPLPGKPVLVQPALQPHRRTGGAYLAALSKRLNRTCSNRTASSLSIGRSAARADLDAVLAEDLARPLQGRADDLADVVAVEVRRDSAGFQPRHVEQVGDEAVQPLRLLDDGGQQVGLGGIVQGIGEVVQGAGGPEDRGKRGLQIVRDARSAGPSAGGRSPRRAWPCRDPRPGGRARWPAPPGRTRASNRRRCSGVSSGPGLSLSSADDADGAASGAHRQEQALRARQRVGAAPRRAGRSRRPISPRRDRPRRAGPRAGSRP